MSVREINIADHWDAALPLMRENWAETGFEFEFAPSRGLYVAGQATGMLLALGAFVDDELVGYSTAVLAPHAFNPAVRMCMTDALYVAPQHRKGLLAGRLILTTEMLARERGARLMSWHTRAGTMFADMLRARGYEDGDVVVMKEL